MRQLKNKSFIRKGTILFILLAILMTAGCADSETENNNKSEIKMYSAESSEENETLIMIDRIIFDDNEMITYATHIVEAEYVGKSDSTKELLFRPVNVLKGEISDENDIYVTPYSDSDCILYTEEGLSTDKDYALVKGKSYLLFLSKHISVYYDHDKYLQMKEDFIAEQSAQWEEYHALVKDVMENCKTEYVSYHGTPYTESIDVAEVAEFSDNIFIVKIESVLAESTFQPTTVYECSVLQAIKNTPIKDDNGNIFITLPNNTVEVGEKYIALLSDATSCIYILSSRYAGIFPADDEEVLAIVEAAK